MKWLIWLSAVAALLCGCWTQSAAVEIRSVAPEVPAETLENGTKTAGPSPDGPTPAWPPGDMRPESAARPSATLRLPMTGGAIGLARQDLAVSPHSDAAVLRLTIPVGTRTGATGLAELTAWVVSETPAPDDNRASMRRGIENLEGSLEVRVGANHTSFEANVRRGDWRQALGLMTTAIHATAPNTDQIERIRGRLLQTRRNDLATASIENLITVLAELSVPPERYLVALEDRTAEDVGLFQETHYRTAGTVAALWVPGASAIDVLEVADATLAKWAASFPAKSGAAGGSPTAPRKGVLWSPTDGEMCHFAFAFPLPHPAEPRAIEKLLLLECLTMDGVGGRLEQTMTAPATLSGHVSGVGSTQRMVLYGRGSPDLAVSTWKASRLALASLATSPPSRAELRAAADRLRLRLLARYDDPRGWLDWATGYGSLPPDARGLAASLDRLDDEDLALAAAIAEIVGRPSPLVAIGGQPPADAALAVAAAPAFADPAGAATPIETSLQIGAADEHLKLALRALGGAARLRQVEGLSAELERHTEQGVSTYETVWFKDPERLRRLRRVLATTIETVIKPRQPYERSGERQVRLDQEESRLLLSRLQRHPVILLARYARGQVRFRLVSTRRVGDREMAVLQMIGAADRLRIMIDTESGLVRAVTTRERRIDLGEHIHVTERYMDYRPVNGVRAPFYRVTTVDDGDFEIFTVWKRIEIGEPSARYLAGNGPASLPPKR